MTQTSTHKYLVSAPGKYQDNLPSVGEQYHSPAARARDGAHSPPPTYFGSVEMYANQGVLTPDSGDSRARTESEFTFAPSPRVSDADPTPTSAPTISVKKPTTRMGSMIVDDSTQDNFDWDDVGGDDVDWGADAGDVDWDKVAPSSADAPQSFSFTPRNGKGKPDDGEEDIGDDDDDVMDALESRITELEQQLTAEKTLRNKEKSDLEKELAAAKAKVEKAEREAKEKGEQLEKMKSEKGSSSCMVL